MAGEQASKIRPQGEEAVAAFPVRQFAAVIFILVGISLTAIGAGVLWGRGGVLIVMGIWTVIIGALLGTVDN